MQSSSSIASARVDIYVAGEYFGLVSGPEIVVSRRRFLLITTSNPISYRSCEERQCRSEGYSCICRCCDVQISRKRGCKGRIFYMAQVCVESLDNSAKHLIICYHESLFPNKECALHVDVLCELTVLAFPSDFAPDC